MIRTFPYLEISGTHREIGEAIGETFRGKIREMMGFSRLHMQTSEPMLIAAPQSFARTREMFPGLIAELEGTAEAAGVSTEDLFLHNLGSLTDPSVSENREESETDDHCTIAVSFNEKTAVVGHNEDWAVESQDELYLLKATIGNVTFFGLNYATFVPGVSASINNFGLVQCINELHQKSIGGIPKNFIARAVLECTSLDQAENLIRSIDHESGYNHVLVQGDEVRDIEIASGDIDIESKFREPYVHTNHFLSERLKKYERDTVSHNENSTARYDRAREIVRSGMDVGDMAALLSDTKNAEYPICRKDATIGSVIIEPAAFLAHVCYGPPCEGQYVTYEI